MYLHFEDWTYPITLEMLDKRGLPHDDKIIKVFASDKDPRKVLDNPELTVVESRGNRFTKPESFDYVGRGTYPAKSLESALDLYGLNNFGLRIIRSLFRFSYKEGFSQAAMAAERPSDGDTEWLIQHPFEAIHGINDTQSSPEKIPKLHLDIFFPASILALSQTVDFENPRALVSPDEIRRLRHSLGDST